MSWTRIHELVNHTLFHLGTTPVSVATLVLIAAIFVGVAVLARWTRSMLRDRVLRRFHVHEDARDSVARIAGYVVILFGWLIGLTAVGIDLTSLTVLLGALGVGLGFGLQNVVNNFVSGVILLFERPIRVGDRIQLEDLIGDVTRIGMRSSRVRTLDGIDLIVPNGDFISSRVANWTLADPVRRVSLPVGVAYGTPPQRVLDLLMGVARAHPEVLDAPQPEALFRGFGESSLDFELRIWTDGRLLYRVQSDIAVAVYDALEQAGIAIPFPQRDLHLRSVSTEAGRALAPGTRGGGGR
jgi:small-conductance mechanosensitive channel